MPFLGIPTFIIGLILWLVGKSWFAGAKTVGIILTSASAIYILLFVVIGVFAYKWVSNAKDRW
jgi:hypothetical protein